MPDDNDEENRLRTALTAADVIRLQEDIRYLKANASNLQAVVNEMRLVQARQAERLTLWQAAQAVMSVALAAIAAYVGRLP